MRLDIAVSRNTTSGGEIITEMLSKRPHTFVCGEPTSGYMERVIGMNTPDHMVIGIPFSQQSIHGKPILEGQNIVPEKYCEEF